METVLACLNHFPLFAILLRLKDPDRLPGGLRLEVCPERYFFDRATPLRRVVSSLWSFSPESQQHPQHQDISKLSRIPAPTISLGSRGPQGLTDQGLRSGLHQGTTNGISQPQPLRSSFFNHQDHPQYFPLQQNYPGVSEDAHTETIPRSVSYLFLTVSFNWRKLLNPMFGMPIKSQH